MTERLLSVEEARARILEGIAPLGAEDVAFIPNGVEGGSPRAAERVAESHAGRISAFVPRTTTYPDAGQAARRS